MVCCTEDENDKGCCCCLPSYVGVWIFGILNAVGFVWSVTALFISDSVQVRVGVPGMSDQYYKDRESEMA